jgi:hypothetical protein
LKNAIQDLAFFKTNFQACKFCIIFVDNTLNNLMGEGGGEGEYDIISTTYIPLPFAPLLPPPTSGGG